MHSSGSPAATAVTVFALDYYRSIPVAEARLFLGHPQDYSYRLASRPFSLLVIFRHGSRTRFSRCAATSCKGLESIRKPGLYDELVEFALEEAAHHSHLQPLPMQEDLKEVVALDGKTVLCSNAFESSKMRLFRVATINSGDAMQVLNFAIFAKPEFDLPIFCADFFSTNKKHIIVLDLNPLFNAEKNERYKKKYYKDLMPLVNKYIQVLPWGQDLTTESLQFFSPIVIWTKLGSKDQVQENLFPAFKEYLQEWFNLHDKAEPTPDLDEISANVKAQHRYLLWRANKDPGRPVLHRLFGKDWSENYINEFLFNGVRSMASEAFLDYFPEYKSLDGSINRERSIVGKSCQYRPWDKEGKFLLMETNRFVQEKIL